MENHEISPWCPRKSKYQKSKDEFDDEEERKTTSTTKIVFKNNFLGRLYHPPETKSHRLTIPKEPLP